MALTEVKEVTEVALTEVLSCKFCEIFKNTFFYRTTSVAASEF